jgi:hypothetical protein
VTLTVGPSGVSVKVGVEVKEGVKVYTSVGVRDGVNVNSGVLVAMAVNIDCTILARFVWAAAVVATSAETCVCTAAVGS